ncbi:uncharacterized protein LOC118409234 [Branchiostoma floridae]|uniref:Uncharacterized protein LOC118409234 n=1 Tax=Branchiostoma floridae TaxID=7739 RepID=A0A9J7HU87_BRAFL|nr:uncharacterized protein LOC118409234 [Branchiostoma floridae]
MQATGEEGPSAPSPGPGRAKRPRHKQRFCRRLLLSGTVGPCCVPSGIERDMSSHLVHQGSEGERCSVSSSSPEREPGAGRKSRKQRLLGYFKKKAKPRWPFLAEKSSKSQGTTKLKRDPRLTCSQPDIAHQGYGADSPVRRPSLAPQAANGRVRGPAKTAAEPNGQTPERNGAEFAAYAEGLPKEAGTNQDPTGARVIPPPTPPSPLPGTAAGRKTR